MLKKLFAVGPAALALAGAAGAQILVCEDFSYPDGSLVPNGGWANHSGTLGDLLVAGGQAVVTHGIPSEDANIAFTAVPGNIYYAIDFSVDDLGAPYTAGGDYEYFAHFRNAFDFSARLDVVPPTGAGDFSVGISSDGSTADAIWPTDLTYGTTYRAIARYDQDFNIAELWIDATLETDPSILGADQPDPGDSVLSFALRQSDSTENETVRVDNLVVGRSFADVTSTCTVGTQTPRFAAVPNPGLLSPGAQPNIGTTWDPTVTVAGSVTDVIIISPTPLPGLVTSFGTVLCTIPSAPGLIITSAPAVPFAIAIPFTPSLVGAPICTQGAGLDAVFNVSLTNALDLVIGG